MKRNKAEELVMLSPIEELIAELDSSDQPLLSSRRSKPYTSWGQERNRSPSEHRNP